MNIFKLVFIGLFGLATAACVEHEEKKIGGMKVVTVSGKLTVLDGTYKHGCFDKAGDGVELFQIFESRLYTYLYKTWTGDTTCSGTPSTIQKYVGIYSENTSTVTTSGWVDNASAATTAPNASNGSGQLSNNESVTLLTLSTLYSDFGHTIGSSGIGFFVVDDTAVPYVIYEDDDAEVDYDATNLAFTRQ